MAENEILDLGNPRRYARFRHLLASSDATVEQVVVGLIEDVVPTTRAVLRRQPLYMILKACGQDRATLRQAVAGCTEWEMASLTVQAHAICRSNDPVVMGQTAARLLVEKIADRVRRFSLRDDQSIVPARRTALLQETERRLNECRSEIEGLIAASLRGEPIKRTRRRSVVRSPASAIIGDSLILRPGARKDG
jgi:hypothetical protein